MTKQDQKNIAKELLITFTILFAYQIGIRIPLPFLNIEAFLKFSNQFENVTFFSNVSDSFSVFSLGLMPYVSGYVIIEILSLFVPQLKRYRGGDNQGRIKLKGYALFLALFLAIMQSIFVVKGIKELDSPYGRFLDINSLQFAIIVFVQVFCVFLIFLGTEIISLYGIGNGISLIILTGILINSYEKLVNFTGIYNVYGINVLHVTMISLFIVSAFIFVPVFLMKTRSSFTLKHKLLEKEVDYFQINACPSGKISIGFATTVISYLGLLFININNDFYMNFFGFNSLFYNVLKVILILVFSYIFAWLFLSLPKRSAQLSEWGWNFAENTDQKLKDIKKRLMLLNLPWSVFLCALSIMPFIVFKSASTPFYLGGSSIFIAGIIVLDLISRFKLLQMQNGANVYRLAELHDVYYASMIKNHLKAEGVRFYMQGYYHRHLLYFFGPYIGINLIVLDADKNRATEIIKKFYNGIGLI